MELVFEDKAYFHQEKDGMVSESLIIDGHHKHLHVAIRSVDETRRHPDIDFLAGKLLRVTVELQKVKLQQCLIQVMEILQSI